MVAGGMLLAVTSSYAQVSPFRGSFATAGLSKADVDLVFDTTKRLNDSAEVRAGDTRAWREPKDGAAGTISVVKVYQSQGMVCHALRYDFDRTAKRPARTYTGDWCKTANGEWKIKN